MRKPIIKFIQMKSLEILVIGAPKCGKTALIGRILGDKESQEKPADSVQLKRGRVGMHVHKKEHVMGSGETVRLNLWDPTVSMLP